MNRIIKFRAWNGKEMISPDHIDRDGYGYWKENSIPCGSNKLMQFTGLMDKSGKEIYEGDILTDHSICDDYGTSTKILVGFSEAAFRIDKSNCFCGDCIGSVLMGTSEMTVIGNLYENPELLNQ